MSAAGALNLELETRLSQLDDERCWQAVLEKDVTQNGRFVYAVRTTGVYCRPSCSSRRPNRVNVAFFVQPGAAELAGFRACRRCRPLETDAQVTLVEQACRYLEANLNSSPTLSELSSQIGSSPFHLQRVFKRITGISPRQYADALRMGQLKKGLQEQESVTTALYEAGYSSTSRLYERTPSQLGMTPTTYQKAGKGSSIAYTIAQSSLGYILVAATGQGICAIRLGDEEASLETTLEQEYRAARLYRDDDQLAQWVEAILRYLDGQQPHLDLPLDIQATAFQKRVWEELQRIPYGSTRTYGEVARAIGQPGAVRAVARACATNSVALAIPCHRVIREDGNLAGYRWGIVRKQRLLESERRNAAQ